MRNVKLTQVSKNLYRDNATGVFYARFYLDGRDVKRCLKTTDEAVARRLLDGFKDKLAAAPNKKGKPIAVEEAFVRFFEDNDERLAPHTRRRYRASARQMLDHFRGMRLGAIDRSHINAYVNLRRSTPAVHRKTPVTDATILRDLVFLSAVLKWARRNDFVGETFDPLRVYDKSHLKESEQRVRWLDRDSMDLLLKGMDPIYAAMVKLCAETALRWNELRLLRWEWFSTIEGKSATGERERFPILNLPGTLSTPKAVIRVAKGAKGRTIPLTTTALDALRASPTVGQKTGWVWPNVRLRRNKSTLFDVPLSRPPRCFAEVCQKIGLTDFHFHDLRHHAASTWRQSGMDLAMIKEIMGHSDYATTLKYAHVGPEHLVRAIGRYDATRAEKDVAGLPEDFFTTLTGQPASDGGVQNDPPPLG